MAPNIAVKIGISIVIIAVAISAYALYHGPTTQAVMSTTSSISSTIAPTTTTTIVKKSAQNETTHVFFCQGVTLHGGGSNQSYMSESQVINLVGQGGIYSGCELVNVSTAGTGNPIYNNVTSAWLVQYTAPNGALELNEQTFQAVQPSIVKPLYTDFSNRLLTYGTSATPLSTPYTFNVTNATANGMTYSYVLMHTNTNGAMLIGFKGSEIMAVFVNTTSQLNMSSLINTASDDMP